MADGKVKGMFAMGQNPATVAERPRSSARRWRKLDWLVVRDNFETETATFWNASPEVESGEVAPRGHPDRGLLFPAAQVAEMDGSFTNTQRLIQWHDKAADPPGDARSDLWFTYQLGTAAQGAVRRQHAAARPGLQEPDLGLRLRPGRTSPRSRIKDEPRRPARS